MTNVAAAFQPVLDAEMAQIEASLLKGTRWIVRMETVPGAHEWINIIAVLRMHSGEFRVHPILSGVDLNRIFTPLVGPGIFEMVSHTVVALEKQLANSLDPGDVEMPFGGFEIGEALEFMAKSLEDGLVMAVKMSSGLAIQFGEKIELMQLDHEKKTAELMRVVSQWRNRSLLPGISREQFEAALKMGFEAAWDAKK